MSFNKINREEEFLIDILFSEKKIEYKNYKKINFDSLVKITSSHLMLPSLYLNIKKKNLTKHIPKKLISYLKEIYILNKNRNKTLIKELAEISKILNYNNIEHVLLKGSANIIGNIYNDIGERMIGDIDILTRPNQSKQTIKVLNKNKYNPIVTQIFMLNEEKHYKRHCKKNKVFALEIHKNLLVKKNLQLLNKKKFIKDRIMVNGFFIPSFSDQLEHNIYNYQINDYGNIKLNYSFRSFYDTYLLSKKIKSNFNLSNPNKYIKNYLMIAKELKIYNLINANYKERKLHNYRFKFKYSNKAFHTIDNIIVNQMIKFKSRPKQIAELIINKEYRKYICKKLNIKYY